MKKGIILLTILAGVFLAGRTNAQVSLSVNIGLQPIWGPVGYDHVEYYYFPDIDAYYYVPDHQYIYFEGGRWIFAAALPPRFHDFDVYHAYKAVVNDPKPYLHNERYRGQYARYKGRHDQAVMRDSHDQRYFEIKDHPEHAKWKGNDHREGGDHHEGEEHHEGR